MHYEAYMLKENEYSEAKRFKPPKVEARVSQSSMFGCG